MKDHFYAKIILAHSFMDRSFYVCYYHEDTIFKNVSSSTSHKKLLLFVFTSLRHYNLDLRSYGQLLFLFLRPNYKTLQTLCKTLVLVKSRV